MAFRDFQTKGFLTKLDWLYNQVLKIGTVPSIPQAISLQQAISNGFVPGTSFYNTTTKKVETIPLVYKENAPMDKTLTNGTIQRYSFADNLDSKDYFNMPSMLTNANNGFLYGYFRGATNHSDFSDSNIYQMVSQDSGATWASLDTLSDADLILESDVNGGYDAPAVCQTPTGRLLMFVRFFNGANAYIENRTYYSDDDGATWTQTTNPWGLNSTGYVYYDKLVVGQNGEICIAYRDIQADRYIRVAQSTDDGLTWTIRSTALDNSDEGWNFGECMIEDFGSGLWIMISRFSDANTLGEDYPFICVSRDYGKTWGANGTETLSWNDIETGVANSGFLQLEGVGVTLGSGTTTKSCLPYFQKVFKEGKRYVLLTYHLRRVGDEGQVKLCVFDIDKWLEVGQEAIEDDVQLFVYPESPEGPGNIYDVEGNQAWVIDSNVNPTHMIGITSFDDVTGGGSGGPQTIHFWSCNLIEEIFWLYENRDLYHGIYEDDTAAATATCAVGEQYFNTTNNTLATRMV